MGLPVSPLAPARFPDLPPVDGLRLAGFAAGLKPAGQADLMVAELAPGTTIAGVFTRSKTAGAPVLWCGRALAQGRGQARAIVVNSGNSNAFTGIKGDRTVAATVARAAQLFGCSEDQVFVASTGVIGVPMAPEAIADRLADARDRLAAPDPAVWASAADAIRTTDTFPKGASAGCEIAGVPVTIAGIAKGSGMIAPDMATMLGFVFTDAALPAPVLQALLAKSNQRSFNSITVDGDTSTSDTVLLAATGAAANPPVTDPNHRSLVGFRRALDQVTGTLARQIVRDGEGATKLIELAVTGATSPQAARRIGLAIANSPLVKTAVAGGDANWGRIVMAVGKSGEAADRDRLSIAIGGHPITRGGQVIDGYDEAPVAAHMKGQEISIAVDLGLGRGRWTVWTCDLTHGYISINADYRS